MLGAAFIYKVYLLTAQQFAGSSSEAISQSHTVRPSRRSIYCGAGEIPSGLWRHARAADTLPGRPWYDARPVVYGELLILKTMPFSMTQCGLFCKYKQNFIILVRTGMFFCKILPVRTAVPRFLLIFASPGKLNAMKNNESKYKQVVNFVIDGITEGRLQKGDWIPSINEFRENYRLSRDTVFAG